MMIQSVMKIDKKERAGFLEFALQEGISPWTTFLLQGRSRSDFADERRTIKNKYYLDYLGKNFKNLEKKIGEYGVDCRNQFYQTPLHISVLWGVSGLIETLRDQGADTGSFDTFGRTPLSVGIFQSLRSAEYMNQILPEVYGILSEIPLAFQSQRRLVKVTRRSFEYFLFHLLYSSYLRMVLEEVPMVDSFVNTADSTTDTKRATTTYPSSITPNHFVFDSETLACLIAKFPDEVVGEHRKRREYLSSLLSKNEISRTGPYNRGLFVRVRRGSYAFNPNIFFAQGEDEWFSIGEFMNLGTLANTLQLASAKALRDLWSDLPESTPIDLASIRSPSEGPPSGITRAAPQETPRPPAQVSAPSSIVDQMKFPGF